MSTPSAAARRDALPALTLRRVLDFDAATRELDPKLIGFREITRSPSGRALVEPLLLLAIRRRLAIARDEREQTENAVDLVEEMLQGALRLGADCSGVEHAIHVAQSGEDDAHRLRDVEVVVHRLLETDPHPADGCEDRVVASVVRVLDGRQSGDARLKVDEPLHRYVAVGEQLIRILQRLAVMGSRREKVAK